MSYYYVYISPGTGTIVGAVKIPARREPIILGKPQTPMFDVLKTKFNLDPQRSLMVGDR
jgi:ribonucleotide monophosphatase NagD (HAD superfamily)